MNKQLLWKTQKDKDNFERDLKRIEEMFDPKDNNDYYFFSVKLIYNTFITNHSLTDGNKRAYKHYTELVNARTTEESLK